jgi:hypothetical protein
MLECNSSTDTGGMMKGQDGRKDRHITLQIVVVPAKRGLDTVCDVHDADHDHSEGEGMKSLTKHQTIPGKAPCTK